MVILPSVVGKGRWALVPRSWAGEVRDVSLLVAIGINGSGYREILGICEGPKQNKAG